MMLHVQFWEAENNWRLDRTRRRGRRCHIPGLVDASGVRALNVLLTQDEMSHRSILRERHRQWFR